MTTLREAAQRALEALVQIHPGNMTPMAEEAWNKAIDALRAALAEPAEQEPESDTEGEGLYALLHGIQGVIEPKAKGALL